MTEPPDTVDRYLRRLEELPFVERAKVARLRDGGGDVRVVLRTPSGKHELEVALFKSNLSRVLAERAVTQAGKRAGDWMVMAPAIGAGVGARLEEAGLGYVDLAGNCSLRLGTRYVAHVEGKRRRERDQAELKGLRAAGYKALFALLVQPALLEGTVRELAAAAGVSRQAAHDLRRRLVARGQAFKHGRRHRFAPGGLRDAFELWQAGYAPTLRPALFEGAYRTRDDDPEQLERRLEEVLGSKAFCWGGGAGAHRLTQHYRGERTVIHLTETVLDIATRVAAVPARQDVANLLVLGTPGPLGCAGPLHRVAHPLLIYAELAYEGRGRTLEAAEEVLQAHPLEESP